MHMEMESLTALRLASQLRGRYLNWRTTTARTPQRSAELNLDLEDVQDKDGDKHGDNGENPVGTLLGFCLIGFLFFESAGAVSGEIALAGCGKDAFHTT